MRLALHGLGVRGEDHRQNTWTRARPGVQGGRDFPSLPGPSEHHTAYRVLRGRGEILPRVREGDWRTTAQQDSREKLLLREGGQSDHQGDCQCLELSTQERYYFFFYIN